jgi:hypothetical protein
VATDYDEVRSDVAESRNASLEALRSANAPDARSVVRELDEADTSEGVELPGADLSGEELTVTVIPQKEDEFTCYSCFLVRHRSQLAKEKARRIHCCHMLHNSVAGLPAMTRRGRFGYAPDGRCGECRHVAGGCDDA